jgi:ribonuclease D
MPSAPTRIDSDADQRTNSTSHPRLMINERQIYKILSDFLNCTSSFLKNPCSRNKGQRKVTPVLTATPTNPDAFRETNKPPNMRKILAPDMTRDRVKRLKRYHEYSTGGVISGNNSPLSG